MKFGTALAAALVALTSLPILAQQPTPATQPGAQPGNPAAQQTPAAQPPATEQSPGMPQSSAPAQAATTPMSPVNGELESKLDSKTAKTGDNIVVRMKSSVKTSDGTEIPKGSKLMGHVVAVKPSEAGGTSQVALQFDHVELQGGQSMAVRSQIQSIGSSDNVAGGASASGSAAMPPAAPAGGGSSMSGGQRASAGTPQSAGSAGTAPAANDAPAPGTVVAQNGNIAIQTTAIPGILLANNAPGQQDPRMATASSILLGAKKDIQLDGGTPIVVGVAAAGGQ
jgi:hypothetical protein